MGRVRVCFALVLLMVCGACARPADGDKALFARGCVAASVRPAPMPAGARAWDCHPEASDAVSPYLWVRFDPADLPRGARVKLEGDAMPMAGLVTRVELADGRVRLQRHSAADIARSWTAGTRFSILLYRTSEEVSSVAVRVDRPFDRQVATSLRLERVTDAHLLRLQGMILYSAFFGMLLIVALSALALFVALRARFALAHAGMVTLLALFTFASSSLIFAVFPSSSLWLRTSLTYIGLAWSMALLAPFMSGFLERGTITRGVRRTMDGSAILVAVAGLAIPLLGPMLPFFLRTAYHLAFLPGLLAFALISVTAWRRGSRAIRLVALAWSVPAVFAFERIARALGVELSAGVSDFALFVAMAFQSIVMTSPPPGGSASFASSATGPWPASGPRRAKLTPMRSPGLLNRRAFEERHWRLGDYLAILDFDRFKRINDRHGHAIGDAVLRTLGEALDREVDGETVVDAWRMGGEEFTVLIAGKSIDAAALTVNALRGRIAATIADALPELATRVTLSAGVAAIGEDGIAAAHDAADRSLYHAKAAGRDRLSWEAADQATATLFPRHGKRRAAA